MKYFFTILSCIIFYTAKAQIITDTIELRFYDVDNKELPLKNLKKYKRSDMLIEYSTFKKKQTDSLYSFLIVNKFNEIKKIQNFSDSALKDKNGLVMEYNNNAILGLGNYNHSKKDGYWLQFDEKIQIKSLRFYKDEKPQILNVTDYYAKEFEWQDFMKVYTNAEPWNDFEKKYPKPIKEIIDSLQKVMKHVYRWVNVLKAPVHLLAYIDNEGKIKLVGVLKYLNQSEMELLPNFDLSIFKVQYAFINELQYKMYNFNQKNIILSKEHQLYFNKFLPIHFLVDIKQTIKRIHNTLNLF